jgi:chemotaxis protein CheZ
MVSAEFHAPERPMPQPPAPVSLSEADYDLIEAAVMETSRGRWFLTEYAKRNRHADTMMLLGAIDQLEAALRGDKALQSIERIRFDLFEMAKAIARTKAEIAAIKPEIEQAGKFAEVTAELDSIVQTTEVATSDILAAAEEVQEIAWTLREQGIDPQICDRINAKATDIYTACAFQDLTGQRTGKVIQVLRYLEARINAMIDIWGFHREVADQQSQPADPVPPALAAPSEFALDQTDIDLILGPDAHGAGEAIEDRPAPPADGASPRAAPEPAGATHSEPPPRSVAADPLRPLLALSAEEKIALFS